MAKCKHQNTVAGQEYGYTGRFFCDRAAQGGIEYLETCQDCGATRWVAANGRHSDHSDWTPGITHRLRTAADAACEAMAADHPDWPAIAQDLLRVVQREAQEYRVA